MGRIICAIDVGTTKVCALVGETNETGFQIIGCGIEPSRGMKNGMVVNPTEAKVSIANAIEQAEQSSGYELSEAVVSMAGEHLESQNSTGVVTLSRNEDGITRNDVQRGLDQARAAHVPEGRDVVHIVPRYYAVDSHKGVKSPIGMFGNKLEVEAHVITASELALKSLAKCTKDVGVDTKEFVLNTLASAESVLDAAECEMGVLVADIGGGTTDIALYQQGTVWHTDVISMGGTHFTNDVAYMFKLPYDVAEKVKRRYGNCMPDDISADTKFNVKPFGGSAAEVGMRDLAEVIEARAEELFEAVLESVRGSGYKGMLPAGLVLTGGGSLLRNITHVAENTLNVSARVDKPRNLVGLVERLQSPEYATAVGLLRWVMAGQTTYRPNVKEMRTQNRLGGLIRSIKDALLPG